MRNKEPPKDKIYDIHGVISTRFEAMEMLKIIQGDFNYESRKVAELFQ